MKNITITTIALASLATASANASITWYIQLNNTNLASEVFSVVTNGNLVGGVAAAGEYRVESVTCLSSAYISLGVTQLGYASSNGMGFVWNGTSATDFWSYYSNGPFTQARQEGFQFYSQSGTIEHPTYGTVVNSWWHTVSVNSRLKDLSDLYGLSGTNITGGTSIVSLTNPVPAPGAVALLSVAGLLGRRRR